MVVDRRRGVPIGRYVMISAPLGIQHVQKSRLRDCRSWEYRAGACGEHRRGQGRGVGGRVREATEKGARVEVHGTEGSAVLEDGKLQFWQVKKGKPVDRKIEAGLKGESELGSGAAVPMAALKIEGHRRQIEDFTRAIRTGRAPKIDGREGRRVVVLLEAIYKSARTGRKVKL